VNESTNDERVRAKILEHLEVHPDAADTVAGIASWWFEGDEPGVDAVERALLGLVDTGVMERRLTLDGTPIYGLARTR
jgi:hypothetical protein